MDIRRLLATSQVSTRLVALCVSMLVVSAISFGLLFYILTSQRTDHARQSEQERRLNVISQFAANFLSVRHAGGQLNSARLLGDANKIAAAKAQVDQAYVAFYAALADLGQFDPSSEATIRTAIDPVPGLVERAVAAFSEGREDRETLALLQRNMDIIDRTLRSATQVQVEKTQALREAADSRGVRGLRAAFVLMALMALAQGLLIWTVLRSILRPMRITIEAIRQVNEGAIALDLPPLRHDEFGEVARAVAHFRDRADKLFRLAYLDGLTGLGNGAHLQEQLSHLLAEVPRAGEVVALLLVDLDRFRAINDRHGVYRADRYLCEIASRLQRFVPPRGEVFRVGSDKFALVLTRLPGEALHSELQNEAEMLARAIAEPFAVASEVLTTTATIGIATSERDGGSDAQLLRSAEVAVEASKRHGRGRIRFADGSQTQRMRQRHVIANEINRGIAQNQFELHYQPIVDYARRRVVAAEALLRWRHPVRGLLTAGHFIEVAEEEGLIVRLGDESLRLAHEQARRWQNNGFQMRQAVNLSARQLQDGELLERLRHLRAATGLADCMIDLELTESALFDNSESTRGMLDVIRSQGYRLGLDDFGTGYSSLSYLLRLPIDKIKIDRQFVSDLEHKPKALALTVTTLAMAQSLDLAVVAEGVETRSQAELLLLEGCALQQGFYFSKALPPDEFMVWARAYDLEVQ